MLLFKTSRDFEIQKVEAGRLSLELKQNPSIVLHVSILYVKLDCSLVVMLYKCRPYLLVVLQESLRYWEDKLVHLEV